EHPDIQAGQKRGARARRTPLSEELEARGAVRRAEAGRPVVAGLPLAEITRTAGPVAAAHDVEEPARVRVRVRARVDAAGVPGQRVDARDDRRRGARAAHGEPQASEE